MYLPFCTVNNITEIQVSFQFGTDSSDTGIKVSLICTGDAALKLQKHAFMSYNGFPNSKYCDLKMNQNGR